jgi:hypothetical protein
MSEAVIFIVGALVFAVTVYGAVMAGGLALTRRELDEDEELKRRVDDDQRDATLPTRAEY